MYKYELNFILADCPKSWQNFVQANQKYDGDPITSEVIWKELAKYNLVELDLHGSYQYGTFRLPFLGFEDREDALMFVLNWS